MFDQEKKGGWCFGEAVARDHESVDAESFHDDLCYMLNVTGGTHTHTHITHTMYHQHPDSGLYPDLVAKAGAHFSWQDPSAMLPSPVANLQTSRPECGGSVIRQHPCQRLEHRSLVRAKRECIPLNWYGGPL